MEKMGKLPTYRNVSDVIRRRETESRGRLPEVCVEDDYEHLSNRNGRRTDHDRIEPGAVATHEKTLRGVRVCF